MASPAFLLALSMHAAAFLQGHVDAHEAPWMEHCLHASMHKDVCAGPPVPGHQHSDVRTWMQVPAQTSVHVNPHMHFSGSTRHKSQKSRTPGHAYPHANTRLCSPMRRTYGPACPQPGAVPAGPQLDAHTHTPRPASTPDTLTSANPILRPDDIPGMTLNGRSMVSSRSYVYSLARHHRSTTRMGEA
jgi:hypothetical protein